RVVDIELTSAGKRLKRSAASVPQALACRVGLGAEELARVHRQLARLLEVMRGQVRAGEEKAS
ncbi:MAG TPA: hypothetical protein VF881_21770, partial [Polyangiaceae bacterium]